MQVAHHGSAQLGTGDQSRCSQLNFSGKTLAQCWRTDANHRDGSETQATARCFVFSFLNHQDHSFDAALEALCHAPPDHMHPVNRAPHEREIHTGAFSKSKAMTFEFFANNSVIILTGFAAVLSIAFAPALPNGLGSCRLQKVRS